MLKGQRHVLMEGNPGAAGGGTAAAGDSGTGSVGAATGVTGSVSAGADGAAGTGAANAGSAMAAGAGAEGAGANDWGFLPEKYQVKNDKGEIDHQASAKKVAEAHAALERRLGSGGVPPKSAADYKLPDLPEALKGANFDDAATTKFKEGAHKAGFTQAQFEFVMGQYFEMAPALVNGGQKVSAEDTIKALNETWGADYSKNAKAAWRGMNQIAAAAGLSPAEVEAELGNSPAFNRIMAAVGLQLREDQSVNVGGSPSGGGGEAEAAAIQMSEAFRNPKHPGHQAALAKWHAIVTKGVPDTMVI